MPMHNYLFVPSREPWPASSVNAQIPPVPLLDANGEPLIDKKGKPVGASRLLRGSISTNRSSR